ncbi:hypothetical protein [Bacillus cereus group sp. MYBK74-1]|uniref:hypothetical protein n=1 Tax=Bacillus cereus group sp. MYBK74-1 TaxID=3450610 RepID=UPI003F798E1E
MSNRNIADLFGDSAVRTTEEIKETKQHEDDNNETLKQQNVNVDVNSNVNINDDKTAGADADENELKNESNEEGKNKIDNSPPKDPEVLDETPDEDLKQDDILDFLKVEQERKVVGFHLDKDVRQAFQKVLGKKPQRGAQSELANRIFRDFFEKRGLL